MGIGPEAFQILIPESRGLGAPPCPEAGGGLVSGSPRLEQLSLRGAWPAWVWGADWGLGAGNLSWEVSGDPA